MLCRTAHSSDAFVVYVGCMADWICDSCVCVCVCVCVFVCVCVCVSVCTVSVCGIETGGSPPHPALVGLLPIQHWWVSSPSSTGGSHLSDVLTCVNATTATGRTYTLSRKEMQEASVALRARFA